MSFSALNQLLIALKIEAKVFHNGQYCGAWEVDTSGASLMNFHIVTRGTCVLHVDGKRTSLSVGDAVFIPADAPHKIRSSEYSNQKISSSLDSHPDQVRSSPMFVDIGEGATGLVCGHFCHEHPVFDRLMAQLPKVIIVRKNNHSATSRILDIILEESKSSGQSTNFLLNRLSESLFYVLVRDNISSCNGLLAAYSSPKLSKALDFIHNNIDQRLNIETLAKQAGMSRSSFSELFKKIVELSPADYIVQWKMTQAYRWLADEAISIYDASKRCGYESEASFSKAFKRVIGSGPGEIRQSRKSL